MKSGSSVLIVDIGSASVGACIAEKRAGGEIAISRSSRASLNNASGAGIADLAPLALDALKRCLKDVEATNPPPSSAHIFLAAPWYTSEIRVLNFHSEKELRITQATVAKAVKDYQANHPEEAMPNTRTVESVVSQAYVNGYPTAILHPLKGNTLEIDSFESAADTPFVEGIEAAIGTAFPGIERRFHTFLFSLFAVLRALRDEQSFILIDAGGEITDVAVVRQDGIRFAASFPTGTLSVVRQIAGKGSAADATSRLGLYASGELSDEETAAFENTFATAAEPWSTAYRAILKNALEEGPVPATVFLIADEDELYWLGSVLAKTEKGFSVKPTYMTRDFFKNAITLGEGGRYDAFLSAEAVYALSVLP